MRYRPFGRTGIAVSALSLALNGETERRKPSDWLAIIHGALEHGVNAFEITRPSPALLSGLAEGIAAVRRALLFVSLRADPNMRGRDLDGWTSEVIAAGGLESIDLFTIDAASPEFEEGLVAGLRLKDLSLVRRLAIAGSGDLLVNHVEDPLFDALVMQFGLMSGWRDRNLVRTALERQMAVMSYDPYPTQLDQMVTDDKKPAKTGWFAARAAGDIRLSRVPGIHAGLDRRADLRGPRPDRTGHHQGADAGQGPRAPGRARRGPGTQPAGADQRPDRNVALHWRTNRAHQGLGQAPRLTGAPALPSSWAKGPTQLIEKGFRS